MDFKKLYKSNTTADMSAPHCSMQAGNGPNPLYSFREK